MPVLTAIDVPGTQRYVFASRRLIDIISASWLVHWATSADGALKEYREHVLFAAGSNALLEFDSLDAARECTETYTRTLLEQAPGLEPVVTHYEYGRDRLAEAIKRIAETDLPHAKLKRTPSVEQLGLGVTARCKITGLTASGFDGQHDGPLSRTVLRWRAYDVRRAAEDRWRRFLPAAEDKGWDFPRDFEQMGRTRGDMSLLGIVHLDGNGVGEMASTWLDVCVQDRLSDRDVGEQYHAWSSALDLAVEKAFQAAVDRVIAAIKGDSIHSTLPSASFRLHTQDGPCYLPLRPVLLAGDDLTFVCDGRIALDLAATALGQVDGVSIPHLGRISACAGVSVVHARYPFARAYGIAEQLCSHAKTKRIQESDGGSWIDWHIGATDPGASVSDIRRRFYTASLDDESLLAVTCRPYRLGAGRNDVESWRWLADTVLGQEDDGFRGRVWSKSRNKVRALAAVAPDGPDAVGRAVSAWRVANPTLRLPGGMDGNGYLHGIRTPLLDAVELLDIHYPLGAS